MCPTFLFYYLHKLDKRFFLDILAMLFLSQFNEEEKMGLLWDRSFVCLFVDVVSLSKSMLIFFVQKALNPQLLPTSAMYYSYLHLQKTKNYSEIIEKVYFLCWFSGHVFPKVSKENSSDVWNY